MAEAVGVEAGAREPVPLPEPGTDAQVVQGAPQHVPEVHPVRAHAPRAGDAEQFPQVGRHFGPPDMLQHGIGKDQVEGLPGQAAKARQAFGLVPDPGPGHLGRQGHPAQGKGFGGEVGRGLEQPLDVHQADRLEPRGQRIADGEAAFPRSQFQQRFRGRPLAVDEGAGVGVPDPAGVAGVLHPPMLEHPDGLPVAVRQGQMAEGHLDGDPQPPGHADLGGQVSDLQGHGFRSCGRMIPGWRYPPRVTSPNRPEVTFPGCSPSSGRRRRVCILPPVASPCNRKIPHDSPSRNRTPNGAPACSSAIPMGDGPGRESSLRRIGSRARGGGRQGERWPTSPG